MDGVLCTAQDGDPLEKLEELYGIPVQEINDYMGNDFDLTQTPQLTADQQIIIPNGSSLILWTEAQKPGTAQTGLPPVQNQMKEWKQG